MEKTQKMLKVAIKEKKMEKIQKTARQQTKVNQEGLLVLEIVPIKHFEGTLI